MSEWTNEIKRAGWYWIRGLPADAPPQRVRCHDSFGDDGQWLGAAWWYWTAAGWVTIPFAAATCEISPMPVASDPRWTGSIYEAGWYWCEHRDRPVRVEWRGGEWREWSERGGWERLGYRVCAITPRPRD